MKALFVALTLVSVSAFAQFVSPEIPAHGLSLKCRTTGDVFKTDYDKDGRAYLVAKIYHADRLEGVRFKLGNYVSAPKDLYVRKLPVEIGTITLIDGYADKFFSFGISNLPDLASLANRRDTFSALLGVVPNPQRGGFATNVELRCQVR